MEERINWKTALNVSLRLSSLVWKNNRIAFSTNIFSTIFPGITPIINAYIYKVLIDIAITGLATKHINFSYVYLLLGIRVFIYIIQEICYRLQDYSNNIIWNKMPIVINQIVFSKLTSLDIQYFENSDFKTLLERVQDAATWRPQTLISSFILSLQSIVQVLIALIAFLSLNWQLTLIILLISIPEYINQLNQSKTNWGIWHWNSPFKKRFWYIIGILQSASFIKELKLFQLSPTFLAEIKSIQEKFFTETLHVARKYFFLNALTNTFSTLVSAGIEIFVFFQALAGKATIGDVSFYGNVLWNFQNGISGLFRNINNIYEHSLYVKSIFDILDTKEIISHHLGRTIRLENGPQIDFENVSFVYPGTDKKILTDFSLSIQPGQTIAFVGENGAGKSTIIKLLTRLYDVTSGRIMVNRQDIKSIILTNWYQQIGVLFQDFQDYEYTVSDNIHFGSIHKEKSFENIQLAAKESGAHNFIKDLPKEYEQMLGRTFDDGLQLSVGQWQKIALARAFYRNAPILILDEPTAAIDAKAEAEIFQRVKTLARKKTVIIISHRFSTVRLADIIYVINNGTILESGNHEELMKRNGKYAELFMLQAKGYQ